MRTLRLTLAGTVILALLVGVTGAVVAREDGAEEVSTAASPVTGRVVDGRQDQPYSISNDADRARFRGAVYVDPIEMDDPRLSGTLWQAWSRDALRNTSGGRYGRFGQLITGTIEITNDEGSWVGKSRGYIHPETNHMHFQIDLAGTGAYEGYSALLYAKGPSNWDVEGLIFPGALPDFPGPVEAIAEPVEIVVASRDAMAGYIVVPELRIVSAAEVGPDVMTNVREVKGRIAAVDIPAGQPITPDLLELAE